MRYEYKYLVDEKQLDSLRSRLLPFCKLDAFSNITERKEYTVRSIYFDSSNLKYYHEKVDGIRRRKKVRIRGYNIIDDESIAFLEIKRKYGSLSRKNRSPVKYSSLEQLAKDRNFHNYVIVNKGLSKSLADAENFLHHIYKRSLKPVALIVYDREAFHSKFDSTLRLTFDKNLRYLTSPSLTALFSERGLKHSLHNKLIFEIKFNTGFPSWLQSILREFQLPRKALSKYTICLEHETSLTLNKHKRFFRFEDPFNTIYNDNIPGKNSYVQ